MGKTDRELLEEIHRAVIPQKHYDDCCICGRKCECVVCFEDKGWICTLCAYKKEYEFYTAKLSTKVDTAKKS